MSDRQRNVVLHGSQPTAASRRRRSGIVAGVIVVLACGAAACSDGTGPTPGLHVLSGAARTDTIQTQLSDPLSVVLVDAAGNPAAGEIVSFTVEPIGSVGLAREGSDLFLPYLVDTTDAHGRAAARVRFGITVGEASVIVRASSMDFADTARYTITPGAAAGIALVPADTVVYVGATYTVDAVVVDGAGNIRDADLATSVRAFGPATLDGASGAVTTTDFGRVGVEVRAGAILDTAWASVVPRAWVAAQEHYPGNGGPIGIFLMQLDGSGKTPLAQGLDNAFVSGQGFGWSPDGRQLAIARGDSVDLVEPGSPERRIVDGQGAVLLGARFSHDGEWIYFARAGKGLFRVHPDGSGEEHLGYGGTEWGEDFRPSPSPDGRAVAYGRYRSPCGVTDCIRVLDLASGAEHVLISGSNVAWSPAGDVIAYVSGAEVGLIRPDGSGRRVLGTTTGYVKWMDWSPDGRWLVASPGAGPVLLFDTTDGTRLPLASLATYGATAWRPDAASSVR